MKTSPKRIKKVSIAMLCQLVQTSDLTRKKIWEQGGPLVVVSAMKQGIYKPMLLNALLHWVRIDPLRVDQIFTDFTTVERLCEMVFTTAEVNLSYILPTFAQLVQASEKLTVRLSKSSKFIQRLVEQLSQCQDYDEDP